jgi:hypothetical protein
VGSTFGTGATGPREFDEGWEHLYQGDLVVKRLASLGFFIQPWQTVRYADNAAIGRFEGTSFDPVTWKPRVPTAAFRHAQPDDLFWAARRVMAFSDDMIRAIAKTGGYSSRDAERHLADVLIQRRDKIGAAYLAAVNPLVNVVLSSEGRLSFENAAVTAGVAPEPPGGYEVRWARFDNDTAAATPIGQAVTIAAGDRPQAPPGLPETPGGFIRVSIAAIKPAHRAWATPVHAFFRRDAGGWKLVGLERSGS